VCQPTSERRPAAGNTEVKQTDIRRVAPARAHGGGRVSRRADNLDIRDISQHSSGSFTHHGMVVHQ